MATLPELKLREGGLAPEFEAETQTGERVALRDLRGKPVVLYFYPRDDTPGCTKEACAFRDEWAEFEQAGAEVLGVSVDNVKSHQKFATKYMLPFRLLADPEKRLVQAYGAWGQKSFMGRKYEGVYRVTFLIDREGQIQKIWPKVKAAEHAKEVLEEIRRSS